VIWAALGLVAVIAILLRAVGVEQMPTLQNVYLVPVLWAALTRGTLGGVLAGLVAGLVQSLSIFPFIELVGLSWPALGGVLALSTPLTLGLTVGRLVDRARGRGAQLDALLSIQRSLADSALLTERLATVAELTRAALDVDRVRLVLETGHDASVAASAPQSYRPAERVPSAGATPCRRLVLGLDAGQGPVGALIIERDGDLPTATRGLADALALGRHQRERPAGAGADGVQVGQAGGAAAEHVVPAEQLDQDGPGRPVVAT